VCKARALDLARVRALDLAKVRALDLAKVRANVCSTIAHTTRSRGYARGFRDLLWKRDPKI
jgi:hypothetical protein